MNYAKDSYNNVDCEYYVNKANDNIENDYDYSELYLKDALELADLIFKTNQDKIDFLKQIIPVRGRASVFTVVRLFSYKTSFF